MTNQTTNKNEIKKNNMSYTPDVSMFPYFKKSSIDCKKLKEENKKYKEYYDKWSEILTDIDGDEFCDLLSDYGWEYNDEGDLVNICVDYENDEVDYYIDAGRKVVLKDGRIVKRQD